MCSRGRVIHRRTLHPPSVLGEELEEDLEVQEACSAPFPLPPSLARIITYEHSVVAYLPHAEI